MKKKTKGESGAARESLSPPFQIEFRVNRAPFVVWMFVGTLVGVFLMMVMNTVAQWLGAILVVCAIYYSYRLIRSFMYKPGRIFLQATELTLSKGLCHPDEVTVQWSQIQHAFFLKRAIPWSANGPVLVIETTDDSHLFPREWFGNDGDQKRILVAIHQKKDDENP